VEHHTIVLARLDGRLALDAASVVDLVEVFREARRAGLQFTLDLHDAEEDRAHFSNVIVTKNDVWVARVRERIVGFIAFADGWVNHLYVSPRFQGRGVGGTLLSVAPAPSLQLWAFGVNVPAIQFYQHRGFRILERTDGSGNEAKQPDVLMQWNASNGG
jgi:GNAT superfamily N-acetyltransferase